MIWKRKSLLMSIFDSWTPCPNYVFKRGVKPDGRWQVNAALWRRMPRGDLKKFSVPMFSQMSANPIDLSVILEWRLTNPLALVCFNTFQHFQWLAHGPRSTLCFEVDVFGDIDLEETRKLVCWPSYFWICLVRFLDNWNFYVCYKTIPLPRFSIWSFIVPRLLENNVAGNPLWWWSKLAQTVVFELGQLSVAYRWQCISVCVSLSLMNSDLVRFLPLVWDLKLFLYTCPYPSFQGGLTCHRFCITELPCSMSRLWYVLQMWNFQVLGCELSSVFLYAEFWLLLNLHAAPQ